MKHIILIILAAFILSISAFSQNEIAEAQKHINDIKANVAEYIYAESTNADVNEAYLDARTLLEAAVEDWAKETNPNGNIKGCIAKSDNSAFRIDTRRGQLYRVFLYVKKSDIITFSESKDIVIVPVEGSDNSEGKLTDNGGMSKDYSSNTKDKLPSPSRDYSEKERRILAISDFNDIEPFISDDNNIVSYGKYRDIPYSGDCYLFVYDRNGNVVAHLMRVGSDFIDIKSGDQVTMDNYKGCGAIWFQYKK